MPERKFNRSLTAATGEQYSEQLSALAKKISSIRKDISYFDAYNITQGVSDKNQLSAAIAALPPGSALVVNFQDTYKLGGREYKTGDVVLRTINGEEVYISSQVGGTYYPHILTKSGSDFSLTFSYIESEPADGDGTLTKKDEGNITTWTVDQPHKNISFPVNSSEEVAGGAYSAEEQFDLTKKTFNGKQNDKAYNFNCSFVGSPGVLIQPLIKFVIKDDAQNILEELELEYTLTKIENAWKVTLKDDYPNLNFWVVVK